MLPSYIIQDSSSLNGCLYDCRPRYWISKPMHGSVGYPCAFLYRCVSGTALGTPSPHIVCYPCFKKSYRVYYTNGYYDINDIDIYGNIIATNGNLTIRNVELCQYIYDGKIVKYINPSARLS